jgi:uncharacterized protein
MRPSWGWTTGAMRGVSIITEVTSGRPHVELGALRIDSAVGAGSRTRAKETRGAQSRALALSLRQYIVHTTCSYGDIPDFEWDPAKAVANLRKHGVTFEEAQTAFSDEMALVIDDPDHSRDEARFVLLGMSAVLRVVVVVHACRSAGTVIRIISARKATNAERTAYWRRQRP